MTSVVMEKELAVKPVSALKVKLVAGAAAGMGLVSAASAAIDINGTVGPILDSVIALIPTIVELIIAIVPAIITLAVIGFIISFFDRILALMKF